MFLLCTLLLLGGESFPIKVRIGDPVIDLPITSVETGVKTNLKDILNEGFSFFLAPSCSLCQEAMSNLESIRREYNTVFIYVGKPGEIRQFIKDHNGNLGNSFFVDHRDLKTHGLVTFPVALTYKEGQHIVAMQGDMTPENLEKLLILHNRNYVMTRK